MLTVFRNKLLRNNVSEEEIQTVIVKLSLISHWLEKNDVDDRYGLQTIRPVTSSFLLFETEGPGVGRGGGGKY